MPMAYRSDVEQSMSGLRPLVVLGMHRSGTSLAVRLLADVGIHMGQRLSRDAEAIFFQKLNRRIYRAVGIRWGYVTPLIEAMREPSFVARQTDRMREALFGSRRPWTAEPRIADFFGPSLWPALQDGETVPWGWKDPRTTLTFPIWLPIFPQARVVHIVRNGIDVAISTHRRSQRQRRSWRKRLLRLDYCPMTLDFAYCFSLWEQHVSFVLEHRPLLAADQYLEIRYEELLAAPAAQLRRMAAFIGHDVTDRALAAASKRIDQSRLDNSRFAAPYRAEIAPLAASNLMQQLGYGYG